MNAAILMTTFKRGVVVVTAFITIFTMCWADNDAKVVEPEISEIAQQIIQLRETIKEYNYNYHVKHQPTISDGEYDRLYQKLVQLEAEHPSLVTLESPTQQVAPIDSSLENKIHHLTPLYSLKKAYNFKALQQWENTIVRKSGQKPTYVAEIKLDGLAVNLVYKNGQLFSAATRGNGILGENVTANMRTLTSLPQSLPEGKEWPAIFEIRGEVLMPKTIFGAVNQNRSARNLPPFSSPRHAAAGSLLQSDAAITAQRGLLFMAYQGVFPDPFEKALNTHWAVMAKLSQDYKLTVHSVRQQCQNLDDVKAFINDWEKRRDNLSVATDGIVVKVDNLNQQKQLGYTAKYPRWAIAYKYGSPTVKTTLRGIDWQVGRAGQLTPVGILKPVDLQGATIERVTLHNAAEIQRLGLTVGDTVVLEKAGQIIPHIIGAERDNRYNHQAIDMPVVCPSCKTPLVFEHTDKRDLQCPNYYHCPAQQIARLKHWAGKNGLNIHNLGPSTINKLYNAQKIKTPADFYTLTTQDLSQALGIKKKTAENLLASIAKSKRAPLVNQIRALGLPNVGNTTAKYLAQKIQSIEELVALSVDDLSAIKGIGQVKAEKIKAFLTHPGTIKILEELRHFSIIR